MEYTNVVFANRLLVIPRYAQSPSAANEQAVAVYRRLLPRWKIESVYAQPLIRFGGSLHCATMNLYRLPNRQAKRAAP